MHQNPPTKLPRQGLAFNLASNKKPARPAPPYGPRNGDGAPVSPEYLPGYGSVPARKIVPSWALAPRGRTRNTTSCPLVSDDSILLKSSGGFTACLCTPMTTSPPF